MFKTYVRLLGLELPGHCISQIKKKEKKKRKYLVYFHSFSLWKMDSMLAIGQLTISATQPAHGQDTSILKFIFLVHFSVPIEEIEEMFIILFNFG